jgi:hypothetical protein
MKFIHKDTVEERRERELVLGCKILYGLKAELDYGFQDNWADMQLVFDILTACPNIEELEISLENNTCESGWNPYAFDFRSHPSTTFPPLEVLHLSGYALDEESDGDYAWNMRQYWQENDKEEWNRKFYNDEPAPERPKRLPSDGRLNLQAWMEVMDFSHLHTLDVQRPSYKTLDTLKGDALPALKSLTVRGGSDMDRLSQQHNPTTRKARVVGYPIPGCLSSPRHNHPPSPPLTPLSRPRRKRKQLSPLSSPALDSSEQFPNMQKLDINLARPELNSTWQQFVPLDPLVENAVELRELTLRFQSPDFYLTRNDTRSMEELEAFDESQRRYRRMKDAGDEVDPVINKETVKNLFEYLRKKKDGTMLERLVVYVGDWGARHVVTLVGRHMWRIAWYECGVDGDGGEGCEGMQTRNDQ